MNLRMDSTGVFCQVPVDLQPTQQNMYWDIPCYQNRKMKAGRLLMVLGWLLATLSVNIVSATDVVTTGHLQTHHHDTLKDFHQHITEPDRLSLGAAVGSSVSSATLAHGRSRKLTRLFSKMRQTQPDSLPSSENFHQATVSSTPRSFRFQKAKTHLLAEAEQQARTRTSTTSTTATAAANAIRIAEQVSTDVASGTAVEESSASAEGKSVEDTEDKEDPFWYAMH